MRPPNKASTPSDGSGERTAESGLEVLHRLLQDDDVMRFRSLRFRGPRVQGVSGLQVTADESAPEGGEINRDPIRSNPRVSGGGWVLLVVGP